MVGESGSNHFWLMVQHRDKYPDFQKKMLKANVFKIRKEYTLEPLKGYLNLMTQMHYDMNKKSYQDKGIMQANLYE